MPISGYFDTVFASSGDLAAIPDTVQGDGSVSFTQGYGADYSLAVGVAGRLTIERTKMNQLFYYITSALQQYQQHGTPPFITTAMNGGTPYSYSKYDRVLLTGVVYQSLVNSNTTTPPSASWVIADIGTQGNLTGMVTSVGLVTSLGSFTSAQLATALTDETGTGAAVFAGSPTFTGTPTLPTGTIGVTQSAGDSSTKLATTAFVGSAAVSAMAIHGFLPSSIAGTNTTASLTVSAGQATDTTGAAKISKASTTAWAASNGNAINGYSGGATLPNSSTIHFYACTGGTGTGIYAIPNSSYPLAAASAPAGYNTSVRRVFSLNTTGAGALIGGVAFEAMGGGLVFEFSSAITDINTAPTAAFYALTVPTGIYVEVNYKTNTSTSGGVSGGIFGKNQPAGIYDVYTGGAYQHAYPTDNRLYTNDGTIYLTGTGITITFYTYGFTDFRRD